jgi:malate dehydrogenase (oxaloacetate-decarboxylating)
MSKLSSFLDHAGGKLATTLRGQALLRQPLVNKGTAFDAEERAALGVEGLLPPHVSTLDEQLGRAYRGFQREPLPLAKYQYLRAIQDRNEVLFYALLERHLEEMLPIVYTPTVGEAIQQWNLLYQNARGISISSDNVKRAKDVVDNYVWNDVRMIVATDSSAILGIGDQGYGGLGITIGKLALYTVAGGVSPFHAMPVGLDVGTNRKDLLADPFYLGVRHARLEGDDYLAFLDAFVDAVQARYPRAVIQWEDLSKDTAFTVLARYRKRISSFNDDIQGTGAVALAGLIAACKLRGQKLADQRVVIHGAGAGGAGVAQAILQGMMREGLSRRDAGANVFVLDSKGLLLERRPMEDYKKELAQPAARAAGFAADGRVPSLLETVRGAKATVLLGLSGTPRTFGEDVVRAALANTPRPVVFPLSNPTTSSEALPEDVLRWTNGAAIVATGSPFAPVVLDGKTHVIGQGNNAFVFPGIGFGAILAGAREVTDAMVLEGSYALARYIEEKHLPAGRIYPAASELQEVSARVAASVVRQAVADDVATEDVPQSDLDAWVRRRAWRARYLPVVRSA